MSRFKSLETRGQSFSELCSVNAQYAYELGTSGERRGALGMVQARLQTAMDEAVQFQKQGMRPQATELKGVKNLVAFHANQDTKFRDAKQAALNDKVIHLRKWLSRQGAWFEGQSGVNWKKTMKPVVRYDADLQKQGMSRVRIQGGLLFTHDGKPLDTAKMVTYFSGPGHAIYVMSGQGHLHVGSHSVGSYHHSSLLAAQRVAGAGELSATGGRITFLSNKSGHYWPGRAQMLNVLGMLQHEGVPLNFRLTMMPEGKRFSSVAEYMKDQMLDDDTIGKVQQTLQVLYIDGAAQTSSKSSGAGHYDGYGTYTDYQHYDNYRVLAKQSAQQFVTQVIYYD